MNLEKNDTRKMNLFSEFPGELFLELNLMGLAFYLLISLILFLRFVSTHMRRMKIKIILAIYCLNMFSVDLPLMLGSNLLASYWIVLLDLSNTNLKYLSPIVFISFTILLNAIKTYWNKFLKFCFHFLLYYKKFIDFFISKLKNLKIILRPYYDWKSKLP